MDANNLLLLNTFCYGCCVDVRRLSTDFYRPPGRPTLHHPTQRCPIKLIHCQYLCLFRLEANTHPVLESQRLVNFSVKEDCRVHRMTSSQIYCFVCAVLYHQFRSNIAYLDQRTIVISAITIVIFYSITHWLRTMQIQCNTLFFFYKIQNVHHNGK